MKSILILAVVTFFYTYGIFAQNDKDTSKQKDSDVGITLSQKQANNKSDSTSKNFGLLAYPFAFYSPETELAFGAGGMVYFKTDSKAKVNLSKITVSAFYTTNSQYNFSVGSRIFFPGISKFYLEGNLNFAKSTLAFFGLGNNSPEIDSSNYISQTFDINAQLTNFNIFKNIQTGLVYEYSSVKILNKLSNPNMFDPNVKGTDGGKVGGLGFALIADYRDNTSYPTKGFFTKFTGVFFRKPFGSEFSYDKYVVDLRKYFMPLESHILAVQFFGQFTKGADAPFFGMPQVGGSYKLRGYFEGRYRDMQYFTAQAEYRKILFWRIGVAAFYALGEVSPNFSSFNLNGIKHSYGFGLRFVFDPKEHVNLRVDIGVAEGKTGVYFNLEEAF